MTAKVGVKPRQARADKGGKEVTGEQGAHIRQTARSSYGLSQEDPCTAEYMRESTQENPRANVEAKWEIKWHS